MSLLIANELSLRYARKIILDDETFGVSATDRIGLVGPNGTGKSTLMKILAGQQQPDWGEVQLAKGARVGYLAQELQGLADAPLVDAVMSQVPGRTALEAELGEIEHELAEATDEAEQLELAQRLADLSQDLAHFDERFGRHRAEEILLGLGFKLDQLERLTTTFSGGWRMRAALAGLLLIDPDLLMLDEPTNHLDVPTLAWFDGFLRRFRRSLILVSHDRDFLNRQIKRVISFEPEGLRTYPGNYEDYKAARTLESGQLKNRAERQARKRAEVQSFIDRFRAKASKAKQVKSREKMLEKEDKVEILEERRTVAFRFPESIRSGREVVKFEHVKKSYGENTIYRDLSASIWRGDRIAVVGANGAGKTTLVKLIAREIEQDSGTVTPGHNVIPGYYAQHHTERLDPKRTILEEISTLVPDKPQAWVRGVLGSFLFSGDDVEKRIGVLSGGERARVALARLLVVPANLLLMDEPTNHLDLDSSEALIDALAGYDGTLVFVSHNRSFVNRLATKVWDVEGGTLVEYPGNLDDYLNRKAKDAEPVVAAAGPAKPQISEKERKRLEAETRQARSLKEKPLKDEVAKVEKRIAEVEAISKAAEKALADPDLYADFARMKPQMDAFNKARAELEGLYAHWETKQAALEAVRAEFEGA